MVLVRGSNAYHLSPHDEDMQDNPPLEGFAARLSGNDRIPHAKQRALARLQLAAGVNNFVFTDFKVTKDGVGDAGPHTPVEWQHQVTVGHGPNERTWTMIIDMDDIPAGAGGNGPDRPHVGYSYWCRYTHGGWHTQRVNGHIFVEYVNATRG